MSGVGRGKATVEESIGSVGQNYVGGVGSQEWWDRAGHPGEALRRGAVIDRLDAEAMADNNDAYPITRRMDEDYQHSGIPEGWTMHVYGIFHNGTNERGEQYSYSSPEDVIRIYRDENGRVKGVDTPIQSFESEDEREINEKIKSLLGEDGVMMPVKTWANPGSGRI